MIDYVVINGSAVELTNVNAGGSDVAAGAISANLTLDDTEMTEILEDADDNSVAIMNASATDAEKLDVALAIINGVQAATANNADIQELVLDMLDAKIAGIDLSTAALRKQFRLKKGKAEAELIIDWLTAGSGTQTGSAGAPV